jgi:hypothetical protein
MAKSQTVLELEAKLQAFDWDATGEIVTRTIHELQRNPEQSHWRNGEILDMLFALRRKRRTAELLALADVQIQLGEAEPRIVRLYAQALIDAGHLSAARLTLEAIIADRLMPAFERAEAHGLLARIAKRIYIAGWKLDRQARASDLNDAIRNYGAVYESAPDRYSWQGIRWAACVERARRDRLPLLELPRTDGVAREILVRVEARPDPSHWDLTTALEASIVLADWPRAVDIAMKLAAHPKADAFHYQSILDDLDGLWQLDPEDAAQGQILMALRQALLRQAGGELKLGEAAVEKLEKVWGNASYQPYAWLRTGLERCASITKIRTRMGKGIGTGFVISGGDLAPSQQGKKLVLTNYHVVSPGGVFPGSVAPEDGEAFFEVLNQRMNLGTLLAFSPPNEFDYALLEVDGLTQSAIAPVPLRFQLAASVKRLYVIGHPKAADLAISLHDSERIANNSSYIHYKTPTIGGNSGSPVFEDSSWQAVALHHAGPPFCWKDAPDQKVNEGILLPAIRAHAQAKLA